MHKTYNKIKIEKFKINKFKKNMMKFLLIKNNGHQNYKSFLLESTQVTVQKTSKSITQYLSCVATISDKIMAQLRQRVTERQGYKELNKQSKIRNWNIWIQFL